jgi:hypothetical protein
MPDANQTFALERTQVNEKALLQLLVGMRVGDENGDHSGSPVQCSRAIGGKWRRVRFLYASAL